MTAPRSVLVIALTLLAGCPSARSSEMLASPRGLAETALAIGQPGHMLAGVAGDGAMVYVALATQAGVPSPGVRSLDAAVAAGVPAPGARSPDAAVAAGVPAPGARSPDAAVAAGVPAPGARSPDATPAGAPRTAPVTTIEAIRPAAGAAPAWRAELAGYAGPIAATDAHQIIAALGGTGDVAGVTVYGEPGSVLAALDARTGAPAWTLAIDATEWAVISAIATMRDGVVVGGAFSGTLRIGHHVVSSAGLSDGFVARIAATGAIAWLVRVGGPGADAVHGVAASADRIAFAGAFTAGADLLGEPLTAGDARSPRADGFVAELDATGARRWVQCFGSNADDAVAGVAIDARGRVAVAATARGTVRIGTSELTADGVADGLVAWWSPDGERLGAVVLGGSDFDGLRGIVSVGERVVVAGFYSGSIQLGDRAIAAGGGDDAFLAELDPTGRVVRSWPIGGDGREEIAAIAAVPGGFVAGVAHTADVRIDGATLPAPADPSADLVRGAAILVRAVE